MSNEIALVTGASHGIGLEVVRQLAQRGQTLILTARILEKGENATRELIQEGLNVFFKQLDVTSLESLQPLAKELEEEYGRLDVLINNAAGYQSWSETPSTADLQATQDVFATTLFGTWSVIQAFLPLIQKSEHGCIVNVSSGAGSHGDLQYGLQATQSRAPSYGVAKAALNALTVKFAAELASQGILVNAVCPGLTATYPGAEAMGARPIPEGAASIIWAAALPDSGPTGGFFRDGQPLPW